MTDPKLPNTEPQAFQIASLLEKHKISLLIGLSGLVVLGAGFLFMVWETRSQDKIEILSAETSDASRSTIHADIEGAVEKPGVYTFAASSRVDDLLIASGGLSAAADREWVEKTLNRAQKLTDGVKVYIPEKGSTSSIGSVSSGGSKSNSGESKLIDINTASQAELETLTGIGPVTAQKIIENRPYQAVDALLTRKILKSTLYQRISGQLSVF